MVNDSVCVMCGNVGPLNENNLCFECAEKNTGSRCIMCGREAPTDINGLCMDCASQQNNQC